MQKQELLDQITALAQQKLITEHEVVAAVRSAVKGKKTSLKMEFGVADVLSYVGGAIVFLGIAVLIWQNWTIMNSMTRIVVTLGCGLAAYVTAVVLQYDERFEHPAQAFFFLSAVLIPSGTFVTLYEGGVDIFSAGVNPIVALAVFGMYMLSYFVFRKNVLLLFSILFGTWAFFAVTTYIMDNTPLFEAWRSSAYRVMVIGVSYLALGYFFQQNGKPGLTGFLYGFGILGFLSAALALGEWTPYQSQFWELIYPGLVIATMLLSVPLKSKSFLVFGAIFLVVYIMKITAEYFTDTLGWPLALVIVGLALIGVGFGTFQFGKKYVE